MDKTCDHHSVYYSGKNEYYFFTLSIPSVSSISSVSLTTNEHYLKNGSSYYYGYLNGSNDRITFGIQSDSERLKCFVSMFINSETLVLSNSLSAPPRTDSIGYPCYDLIILSSGDENFEKLKQHPTDTLVFICRVVCSANSFSIKSVKVPGIPPTDSFFNLKTLAAALKFSSESFTKEKVLLRVGEETETVSKSVLCARSSVFAKMFENDMKELKNKTVIITDIKMPVLKVLVSFLYTGNLSVCDSDFTSDGYLHFLCDLYYAADKYHISELRQRCVHLMLPLISMKNINQFMKLAFSHNDELLKSSVLALIATNIDAWISSNDWRNLIDNDPDVANEILKFLDL